MNKILKALLFCFGAFLALALIGAIFGEDEQSNNSQLEQKEQTTETKTQQQKEVKKKPGIPGTYKVTDKIGQTFTIKLKADKTATFEGNGDTFYCSWSNEEWNGGKFSLSFSDDPPALVFEGGVAETMYGPEVADEWLYFDYSARKAKNPNRRLKITKVN